MIRFSILVGLVSITAGSIAAASISWSANQDLPKKQDDDRLTLPLQDDNAVSRRDFMRTKLLYTQNIFEGLTMGDFKAIETAVAEVQRVTEGEQWIAIDNENYRKLTEEFKTSTRRLMTAAKSKNIDATALRYYEMSTRCIDCHKHIRNAQYEY
jgi:hypothetical protein